MGEVYRAYDTVKDRMVALKLLRGETAADPGFQQRLWRECRKVTRLQEPHVLPLHDFGEIDGVPFIDMHLDVKPENILLTHDHFTYLADFGIAEAAGDDKISRTYMAPERFTTGRIGSQTDVYSLTCVLYECLTGQPPFESEDPGELKSAHLLSPAPRPSIMRRGVGRDYDDIITRGMAKQRTALRAMGAWHLAVASIVVPPLLGPRGAAGVRFARRSATPSSRRAWVRCDLIG